MLEKNKGDKVFYAINDILLLIALLVVLYPLVFIVSSSFSSGSAVTTGRVVLWPVEFSLDGYKTALQYPLILSGFRNTFFYMTAGTLINLFVTVLAAYPLSKPRMAGRKILTLLFMFTMIFSGGLIPNYILMQRLRMVNTAWAMVVPGAVGIFNLIVCRTFFQKNIPEELFESASMDGCNHIRFLVSVVLPLSKPILAVLTLYYAVGHWNAYFNAFIYLSDRSKFPLQIILREILVMNMIDPSATFDPELEASKYGLADLLKYSLIVVSTLPFMIAYPFVAKHFVKGALSGAVKG